MPSAEFSKSVAFNLAYWLDKSRDLDDEKLHELDEERHNIYRAVRFGLRLSETKCDAANLILQIYRLIERRGYWRRWIPLLKEAVKNCDGTDRYLTVALLDRLGQCYRLNRQWDESLYWHGREQELAQEIGEERRLAKSRLNLSQTYCSLRQYDQAAINGELALVGFRDFGGDAEQMGAAICNLGLIALGRGELAEAENQLRQAVSVYRKIDLPALLARTLMNLTITLERGGRYEQALILGQEALDILQSTAHELDKVRIEITLGTLFMQLERLAEAEEVFNLANTATLRRSGETYLRALLANNLGCLYLELGRLAEAEGTLNESINLWRQSGGRLMLANTLGSMAETKLAMNQPQEALLYLDETIAVARKQGDDDWGRELSEKYAKMREKLVSGE